MLKVHPMDCNMGNSISNLSTNEQLERSNLLACRHCKLIQRPNGGARQLFPCHCFEPIHSQCLMQEMDQVCKGQIIESGRSKKFSCGKCKQKIRFTVDEDLRCRPCCQIISFGRSQGSLCIWLSVGVLLIVMLIVILVLFLRSSQRLTNEYMAVALGIGLGIAIGVIFLLVAYFFISELMIERQYEIQLIISSRQRQRKKTGNVEITNCEF